MKLRLTKEERIKKIDYLESLCDKSVFSRKTLGILFRSYHYNLPLFCIGCVLFANEFMVGLAIVILTISYGCWIPFNGCFLSMLENRVCNDDFNVADPFLELCKLEKTKENRINSSYVVGGSYLLFFIILVILRYKTNFLSTLGFR
jgi:hypothetical protein